jgi:sensor histidine kinase YesM
MNARAPRPWTGSFWQLQLIGWSAYYVLIYVTFLPMVMTEGGPVRLLHVKLTRALLGFAISSGLGLIYRRVAPRGALRRTVLLVLGASLAGGLLWTLGENLYAALVTRPFDRTLAMARFPRQTLDYTLTLLTWSALYFGLKQRQALERAQARALHADLAAQTARLEALRNQLHPHFFFNTLNAIRALVDEDPARAKEVVTEVSEFLRYSLLRSAEPMVPLAAEVAALRSYLSIEAIRFEEKLKVDIDIDPAVSEARVPVFVLHPLVENAIKHGLAAAPLPLQLRIRAARAADGELRIEVANSGPWRPPRADGHAGPDGTGTGLRNLSARLAQTLGARARLSVGEEGGWVRARITIAQKTAAVDGDDEEAAAARAPGR